MADRNERLKPPARGTRKGLRPGEGKQPDSAAWHKTGRSSIGWHTMGKQNRVSTAEGTGHGACIVNTAFQTQPEIGPRARQSVQFYTPSFMATWSMVVIHIGKRRRNQYALWLDWFTSSCYQKQHCTGTDSITEMGRRSSCAGHLWSLMWCQEGTECRRGFLLLFNTTPQDHDHCSGRHAVRCTC